jgi:hypothetical protein
MRGRMDGQRSHLRQRLLFGRDRNLPSLDSVLINGLALRVVLQGERLVSPGHGTGRRLVRRRFDHRKTGDRTEELTDLRLEREGLRR